MEEATKITLQLCKHPDRSFPQFHQAILSTHRKHPSHDKQQFIILILMYYLSKISNLSGRVMCFGRVIYNSFLLKSKRFEFE